MYLEAGADPNMTFAATPVAGTTRPRHCALRDALLLNRLDVVELLLQHGARSELRGEGWAMFPIFDIRSADALRLLVRYGAAVSGVGNVKMSALHLAVRTVTTRSCFASLRFAGWCQGMRMLRDMF